VFFAVHFIESLVMSPYRRWNPEHVAWYCYFTLENLLTRNGFYMDRCVYFTRSRKLRRALRWLRFGCGSFFASTLLVIAGSARRVEVLTPLEEWEYPWR